MKTIQTKELKSIQLDILKHIDKFCKDNDIKYFLSGGTMLGAVRHKGFIPWDDDIDIMMFRKDYERFIKIYSEKDKSEYHVYSSRLDKSYPYPYAKIDNSKTVFEEEILGAIKMGVNIDLFPIDTISNNPLLQEKQYKRLDFLTKIITVKRLPLVKKRGFIKNFILLLSHIIFLFESFPCLVKKIEKNALLYNNQYSDFCGVAVWGYGKREINLKSNWDEIIYVPFEDIIAPIPKGYDNYLTNVYGDYMQLPPIEKRISHHNFIAYWL